MGDGRLPPGASHIHPLLGACIGFERRIHHWWLGVAVGLVTVAVMYVADSFPDAVSEAEQETPNPGGDAKK